MQAKAEAVIQAAATGECSASAAESLLRVLANYQKMIHATDLERRVAALEGKPTVIYDNEDLL